MLMLEQQLIVICHSLVNGAVACYLSNKIERKESPQFLPFEIAAIVLDGVKFATDVGAEVQLQLGKEEAEQFYTKPCDLVHNINRGVLGWSLQRFNSVAWTALDAAHKSNQIYSNCGYQNNALEYVPLG
jgi:hypothetical protein